MSVVVVKFGGQSLNSIPKMAEATLHIRTLLDAGYQVAIVVSAFGRKGEPYATDTLLDLVEHQGGPTDNHDLDLLLCCGELIAMAVFSQYLRSQGIRVMGRTGWEAGIITDERHLEARILEVAPQKIIDDFSKVDVVVIAGFQGIDAMGTIHCLGRGGSDTSAVALAVALGAERIEMVKDVEGIYSGDPRLIPTARRLEVVSASDIKEMAWQGSKVLHGRAAELAERFKMPITVRKLGAHLATTVNPHQVIENQRFITGVSVHAPVCQVSVRLDEDDAQEQMVAIFEQVAESGVSMDLFSIMNRNLWFTVAQDSSERLSQVLHELHAAFTLNHNMAKVSIVGAGMHGMPGIMAKFCRTLQNENIPIVQTADSHATISALVALDKAQQAARALHKFFIE